MSSNTFALIQMAIMLMAIFVVGTTTVDMMNAIAEDPETNQEAREALTEATDTLVALGKLATEVATGIGLSVIVGGRLVNDAIRDASKDWFDLEGA